MRSSLGQLKDFKESTIWADISEELRVWINQIHEELEDPDADMTDKMLYRLGGSALAIRNMTNIVDVLIGLAEDDHYLRNLTRENLEKGGSKNGRG